jgi:ABC-type molybdate transport system ATPase subunit
MLLVDVEKRLGDFLLRVEFEVTDGVTALFGSSGQARLPFPT